MYNFDEKIDRENTNCIKYDATDKYFGKEKLFPLWVADMDFKTPNFILDDIQRNLQHGVFGYPKVSDSLFNSIISWQKRRNSIDISKNEIILTNGVVAALSAAIEAFSSIGDEVIIQTPVYFPFFSVVKANKRKLITNPLKNINGYYTMDLENLKSKISKRTKILVLCSPHNPVGRVWSEDELKELSTICLENNIKIVSDEIHSDLVYKKFTSILSISKEIDDISIILTAPSKTFNLAGLCVSYAICKNEKMRIKFQKIVTKREIHQINSLALTAMQSAYDNGEVWLEELKNYLKSNIIYTKEFLSQNSKIDFIEPEATYLLWLNFKNYAHSHQDIKSMIIDGCNLALNDGMSFGAEGFKHFRLNSALPKDRLLQALDKLNEYF